MSKADPFTNHKSPATARVSNREDTQPPAEDRHKKCHHKKAMLRSMTLPLLCLSQAVAADWTPIPEGGESLLPADSLSAMRVSAAAALASSEQFNVADLPFSRAIRIQVTGTPQQAWDVQLLGTTRGDVRSGDVLLLSLFVRGSSIVNESGEGGGTAYLQRSSGAFEKIVAMPFQATGEWKQVLLPTRVDLTLPSGQHGFAVHLGFRPQTVEIGGISLVNYKTSKTLEELPRTQITYDGSSPDAPWREEARRNIDRIRKANVTITVQDADGAPIPDAQIRVLQKRHEFGFGSAVAAEGLSDQGPNGDRYREIVRSWFNKVVLENDLKWGQWEANRNRALNALQWLRDNGIDRVRGHTLVWPGWRNLPRDVPDLARDTGALRSRILKHIEDEVTATRGQLVEWDVLNEPYTNTDVQAVLGEQEMAAWFQETRRHEPDAILYINDYSILSNGGLDKPHQDHYFETISKLIDWGAPLDGIGMQGHFGAQFTSPPKLWSILDRFAQFGKAIQVTEFDIDIADEDAQAAYTRDFITAMFAHPAVKGFMMWGFWEGRHWKPRAALFRRDWSLKPNGQAFYDTVFREYWTDTRGMTGSEGLFQTRAFLGDYELEATAGDRSASAKAVVTADGLRVTLTLK